MSGNSISDLPAGQSRRTGFFSWSVCLLLLLACVDTSRAVEVGTPAADPVTGTNANTEEMLRLVTQLREQFQSTQQDIKRSQEDARNANAQSAQELAARLQTLEQSLAAQRTRELETLQNSNRTILVVASVFAGIGCLAMAVLILLQWRSLNTQAGMLDRWYRAPMLTDAAPRPEIGNGSLNLLHETSEPARQRLFVTLQRLEERIQGLEGTSSRSSPSWKDEVPRSRAEAARAETAAIDALVGRGETFLAQNKAAEALETFEEVLKWDSRHVPAMLKRGMALERLQKLEEAIESYDRAIAMDSSSTIAYLNKGSIYNRLGRFAEAAECYEHALRLQTPRAAVGV